jgi:hypothetical protein
MCGLHGAICHVMVPAFGPWQRHCRGCAGVTVSHAGVQAPPKQRRAVITVRLWCNAVGVPHPLDINGGVQLGRSATLLGVRQQGQPDRFIAPADEAWAGAAWPHAPPRHDRFSILGRSACWRDRMSPQVLAWRNAATHICGAILPSPAPGAKPSAQSTAASVGHPCMTISMPIDAPECLSKHDRRVQALWLQSVDIVHGSEEGDELVHRVQQTCFRVEQRR